MLLARIFLGLPQRDRVTRRGCQAVKRGIRAFGVSIRVPKSNFVGSSKKRIGWARARAGFVAVPSRASPRPCVRYKAGDVALTREASHQMRGRMASFTVPIRDKASVQFKRP